jgi:CRISPR system Cascade subunit CasE
MNAFHVEAESPQKTAGVLFRQEPQQESFWIKVLVQSQQLPQWSILTERLGPGLQYQSKMLEEIPLQTGQTLCFRLRANPCLTHHRKRQGLIGEAKQRQWLEKKAQLNGFQLLYFAVQDEGIQKNYKQNQLLSIYTVLYQGVLTVTQPPQFLDSLNQGIGPAKSLGCGLLSLSRCQ